MSDLASRNELFMFYKAYQLTIHQPYMQLIIDFRLERLCKEVEEDINQAESLNDPEAKSEDTLCRLKHIVLGNHEVNTLYPSQYPADAACLPILYICEFCLCWSKEETSYDRHRITCQVYYPPGDEIYRRNSLSIFEINGEENLEYCRNLCLLSKLFLRQKTVCTYEHIPLFMFYVLTKCTSQGMVFLGYFSKQRYKDQVQSSRKDSTTPSVFSPTQENFLQSPGYNFQYNNLSCLLVMPQFRGEGYGRMLVELSYNLSIIEGRIGTPERPLSDDGLALYRRHWSWFLLNFLRRNLDTESVNINSESPAVSRSASISANLNSHQGLVISFKFLTVAYFIK
ncbi:Histone acetyltransferase kat7 [Cichlidogyrus casuarinus]|uniref:Histone acetyltransferase n=1 Tax=Cichlidogyrus casuarinus TaxID=1844966 RepID=A0ABD2QA87_9PLAT